MLLTLALLGVLVAILRPGLGPLERLSLSRSADLAEIQLERARLLAVTRREPVRVRVSPPAMLVVETPDGVVLETAELQGDGLRGLDSLRLRPTTLRYNRRGQASPGSLYLYKGRRGVRIISNFIGRIRRVPFTVG
jgi:Tfp pilus assembly protein FimT